MLNILLVEDEQEKRRLLVESLVAIDGISIENIIFADDALTAKREISRRRFDLLILDINIPPRPDRPTEVGAGLAVMSYIKLNSQANRPGCIIGMTAHDDGATAAEEVFSSPLWKLVRFSYGETTWQASLQEAVRYLISTRKPPFANDGLTYHVDLGVFVALEDEELRSILQLDGDWKEIPVEHDHSRYYSGRFVDGSRTVTVVVVAAPKMGMPSAAVTASKLLHTFRPKYLAITGICAGVRGKADIGDIVIADPCFDWGSGKWVRDNEELKFRPALYPWRLDEALRIAARKLDTDDVLQAIYSSFKGVRPKSTFPKLLIDAMASGGSVLQAASLMEDVKDLHKNLVGVEMESYAVFTAAQYACEPRPKCISIKSVCDFGDETKEDGAHAYAAHTSAQFLYRFALHAFSKQNEDELLAAN